MGWGDEIWCHIRPPLRSGPDVGQGNCFLAFQGRRAGRRRAKEATQRLTPIFKVPSSESGSKSDRAQGKLSSPVSRTICCRV